MKLSIINNFSHVWKDSLWYLLQVKSYKYDNKETRSWHGDQINQCMTL